MKKLILFAIMAMYGFATLSVHLGLRLSEELSENTILVLKYITAIGGIGLMMPFTVYALREERRQNKKKRSEKNNG